MKKIRTIALVALLSFALFAIAACGGATGTLSSYVSAVKKGDFEKAAEYVVGQPSLTNPEKGSGEIYEYIYDQATGSFKYSVEESTTNDDETICTVKISYSCYSSSALVTKYITAAGSSLISGSEVTKSDVKSWIKEMNKTEGTTTVILTKSDGEWLMEAASAVSLLAIIYT